MALSRPDESVAAALVAALPAAFANLRLVYTKIGPSATSAVSFEALLPVLRQPRLLHFYSCIWLAGALAELAGECLPNLEVLGMITPRRTGSGWATAVASLSLPRLRRLELHSDQHPNRAQSEALFGAAWVSGLESLELGGYGCNGSLMGFLTAAPLTNLQNLKVTVDGDALAALINAPWCPKLKDLHLRLDDCMVGRDVELWLKFASAPFAGLEQLSIRFVAQEGSELNTHAAMAFSLASWLPSLKRFELTCNDSMAQIMLKRAVFERLRRQGVVTVVVLA